MAELLSRMFRKRTSRREFIKRLSTGTALFSIVPSYVLAGRGHKAPSDTVTRAVIGTGGMGMGHIQPNRDDGPIETVAVCDVDSNHLAEGLKKAGRGCEGYSDFRKVLERRDVDTVHVVTPPHWHALISIAAMQAGKDVLSEKPLTRFIQEGRVECAAVERYGRILLVNSYGRGDFIRLRRLIASGLLGSPLTVRAAKRFGCNFKVAEWSGRTNLVPESVPSALDYDMWLGPAPYKPYHPHRVHQSFRCYWDYDGGGLADMAQHWIDPIQYVLGKDGTGPDTVETYAPWPAHPDAVLMWGRAWLRYADGTTIIFDSEEYGDQEKGEHAYIEGPKGRVLERDGTKTDPPGLFEQSESYPVPPRDKSFDEAVKTRDNTNTAKPNVWEAHRSITLAHLVNISIRVGRKIRWDPVKEEIIGDEAAQRFVDQPMRAPWHL